MHMQFFFSQTLIPSWSFTVSPPPAQIYRCTISTLPVIQYVNPKLYPYFLALDPCIKEKYIANLVISACIVCVQPCVFGEQKVG